MKKFTVLFPAVVFSMMISGESFTQNLYNKNGIQKTNQEFDWPDGKKAALSFSFDDARPSQMDNGIPVFDKYGIKVTFYLNPPNMGNHLDQWKKACAEGHEMGNHTMTHPCSGNFPWSRENALESFTLRDIAMEMEPEDGKL